MAGRFFAAIVLVLLTGIAASAPVLAETGRSYYRGGRTASGEVTAEMVIQPPIERCHSAQSSSDQHEQRAFGNRADKRSRPLWSRAHY